MTIKQYKMRKRVAHKMLERAKSLRGTPEYRGALKRAHYELNCAMFDAAFLGIMRVR